MLQLWGHFILSEQNFFQTFHSLPVVLISLSKRLKPQVKIERAFVIIVRYGLKQCRAVIISHLSEFQNSPNVFAVLKVQVRERNKIEWQAHIMRQYWSYLCEKVMYAGKNTPIELHKKGHLHILTNGYVYWENDGKWGYYSQPSCRHD